LSEEDRVKMAAARLFEEGLYERVAKELANGERRDGLWAKALVDCKGDMDMANALYIKYRVQSIMDEFEISEAKEKVDAAQRAEEARRESLRPERLAQAKLKKCIDTLSDQGYVLISTRYGWLAKEPLGGTQKIRSLEELEDYANSRYRFK